MLRFLQKICASDTSNFHNYFYLNYICLLWFENSEYCLKYIKTSKLYSPFEGWFPSFTIPFTFFCRSRILKSPINLNRVNEFTIHKSEWSRRVNEWKVWQVYQIRMNTKKSDCRSNLIVCPLFVLVIHTF